MQIHVLALNYSVALNIRSGRSHKTLLLRYILLNIHFKRGNGATSPRAAVGVPPTAPLHGPGTNYQESSSPA